MIRTNIDKIVKDIKKNQAKISKAEVKALNRAGRDTHPEAKRQLRRIYKVKASTINKAKKTPKKASSKRKRYLLEYQARRVNVKDYGVRQNRRGITWTVRKGKRIKLLHAFKVGHNSPKKARIIDSFGMMRTGRFTSERYEAFKGSARRRKLIAPSKRKRLGGVKKREIIKSVTGPSVPQILNSKNVSKKLQRFFRKKYKDVLDKLL